MIKLKPAQILVLLVIAIAFILFFSFDLGRFLSFEALKAQQSNFEAYYASHPTQTIGIYFLSYVLITALSLPGAAIMTLLGGFLFGLGMGTLVVSFASTLGASLAFLVSRFLLGGWVQERFKNQLQKINEGIAKDGAFYLFSLRLIPLFPFFMINLIMGLTKIPLWQFFVVSQIGMLPGTLVYVNAGTQLGALESLSGILSPALIFSFVLLGLLPLISKRILDFLKKKTSKVKQPI